MSFGISAAGWAAIAAVGASAYTAASAPDMPALAPPVAPPQASKAPDAASVLKNTKTPTGGAGAPGVAGTFLTGAGGIDPNNLLLGKNTLLGG